MLLCVKSYGVLFVLAARLALAQVEARNPLKDNATAVDLGRGEFRIHCSSCHGIHGEGGRGPDLTRGAFTVGDRDADLFAVISKGSPDTEMRPFEGLGEENIWRIAAYLRSPTMRRAAEKIAGDPASGEKLFWGKGGCAQCHRLGLRGGRLGPELTRVGRSRGAQYLRESLISPSASLTPGYDTITVVTRDGKKISGVQRGFDNFSAQLMDSQDNYYSFLKSEVASIEREDRSLMPEYGTALSPAELDDLVAFLSSLGVKR
jgi:cytochrome c oxidase cbb3-type subunit III